MRQKLFTYILAALCAVAAFSCKKAEEDFILDPNMEREVFLTVSMGLDTRAVSVSGEAITASWQEGDELQLALGAEVVTTLKVTSIFGQKAMLSGTVKGAYPEGTSFDLYYGGTSYMYYGQMGTAASAAIRGYLKAENVTIASQDNKTLTLSAATLQHQQAYFQLQFQWGPDLIKVRKLVVENLDPAANDPTVIAGNIVQTWSLDHPDDYTKFSADNPFTVYNSDTEGATTVYFALRDNTADNVACKYRFTVTDIAGRTYTAHAKDMGPGPVQNGHYYSGIWLLDKKQDGDGATTVAPTAVPGLVYDAQAHDLVTPALLKDNASEAAGTGTVVKYFVKKVAWHTVMDVPTDLSNLTFTDSETYDNVPQATDPGEYYVFYKIEGGAYYQDVPLTYIGAPVEIDKRTLSVTKPTAVANLKYTGSAQALVNAGAVKDKDSEEFDPGLQMQYIVTTTDPTDEANRPNFAATATGWSAEVPQRTNAGTYYVWYKVVGGDHYKDVNIPYDEDNYKYVTVTIATSDAVIANPVPIENLVYNGSLQQIVLPADASDGCQVYYFVTTDASVTPLAENGDWGSWIKLPKETETTDPNYEAYYPGPKQKNAGTYYVWTKVVDESGGNNYSGITGVSAAVVASIGKANMAPTAPTLATDLVYNAGDQALIEQAGKLTYVSATSSTQDASNTTEAPVEERPAYMQYAVTASTAPAPAADSNEWKQDAANIVKTDAGTYKVWYRSLGSDNFNPVAPTAVTPNVSIEKAPVAVSGIAGAEGLVYNGNSRALLSNAGSVVYSGGDKDGEEAVGATMEYYWERVNIGENSVEETSGTADSPLTAAQVVGTNAGTYTIYYRANGGTNFVTTDWASLEVIIAQAPGELSISPTSLQLLASGEVGVITVTKNSPGNFSAVINNAAATISYSGSGSTITVTPGATDGNATITVSVAENTNYTTPNPVTCQVLVLSAPTNALTGVFSVSKTKKVFFSKGNLKYSNGTWLFHENQYDMCFTIDDVNEEVLDVSGDYIASGTFDLFGWGTSGYINNPYLYNFPYQTNINDSYYYSGADIVGTNYDWGVYNTISGTTGWRTLTKEEWNFLLHERLTSAVSYSESCSVNDVAGIILLPDNWTNPDPDNISLPGSFSLSVWENFLEPSGAVFLPVFGLRIGTNYQKDNGTKDSLYWTSTHASGTNAYCLEIRDGSPYSQYPPVYLGAFVRLVLDLPSGGTGGLSNYDVEPEQNW